MASYEQVDHTWTRRRMKAECQHRGLRSYARLNKDQLIQFLNLNLSTNANAAPAHASQAVGDSGRSASASGRAADNSHDPPGHRSERAAHSSVTAVSSSERATNLEEDGRLIDDSWTVRELKAECGRRGLRRFARLTKPDLLTLLRRGSSVSVAPNPGPSSGGVGNTTWRQRVSDLKERADDALRSSQFTLALELSSQAIGLIDEDGLIRLADPNDNHTKALLFANRAEARATLGITVEATRDCVEALRLKPDLWKTLLLKARLHMRMCEWELAIQGFQAYLNTDGVSDVSRREATAELEQCRRTQIRTFDQQLGRMEAMLRGMQAEASRQEGETGVTAESRRRADVSERLRRVEASIREDDLNRSADPESGGSRASGGTTTGNFLSSSNTAQSAGVGGGTSAAATSEREGSNGGSCIVCMDNTVSCTFVPCGHFCCCDACADRVGACPVCRTDVERIVRTFMP